MSGDLAQPVVCPKCGQPSRNATICEVCGAVFRRVRDREALLASCGVSKEEAWRMAADDSALEVAASERRRRLMSVAMAIIVVLAMAGGASLLLRKGPPKTPQELIERHRAIATEIQDMYNKEMLASAEDRLALLRHEVAEMEKTIQGLPDGPQSTLAYRKRALGEANALLADAVALSPDGLSQMLAGPDDRNDVALALERLDDAQNPREAMAREERQRKEALAAEANEQRRLRRETPANADAAMPAEQPHEPTTSFPDEPTADGIVPSPSQATTAEQQARVEAKLNALREQALRRQQDAGARTEQPVRDEEQGPPPAENTPGLSPEMPPTE
ncbi:MAG: hypothetical protein N2111_03710 [Candidatus Sumerlaeaceae bacterium]|nr:hypothetical protein [Candidatus Sumerlaeaceae bacterium]